MYQIEINSRTNEIFFGFLGWLEKNKRHGLKPQQVQVIKSHWFISNGRSLYKTTRLQIAKSIFPRLADLPDTITIEKDRKYKKAKKDFCSDWLNKLKDWQETNGVEILKKIEGGETVRTINNVRYDAEDFEFSFSILEKLENRINLNNGKNNYENFTDLIEELKIALKARWKNLILKTE